LSSILDRPPPSFDERIQYGTDPHQFAELRYPEGKGPFPLLFVVHGGFWQSTYDLKHIGHLCAAFTYRGTITCSLEYRRLGDPGGGYPGTFQDITHATNHILETAKSNPRFNHAHTAILGHSAGGHLALWLTSSHRVPPTSPLHTIQKQPVTNAISLAGITDLRTAWKQQLGHGVVTRLLGGTPDQQPDRYNVASPIELLPTGARQVLVHGTTDDIVPVSQSETYVEKARQLGDPTSLVKLDHVGHFELIDPEAEAWPTVANSVLPLLSLR
jgi:acetyl esterase/lipase